MSASSSLDPRVNAFRPDLADASLRAFVEAERFVEPSLRQCVRGVLPVYAEPRSSAVRVSEIKYGEFLDVFEERDDGFLWVQNRSDRYVGYVERGAFFSEQISSLSHRIKELQTFIYTEPDIKAPVRDRLTLGSFVTLGSQEGAFFALEEGGYVYAPHVVSSDDALVRDTVFTAGRLLGVPYLWGGRSPLGIDCSGLVQLALTMAGYEDAPRDSDQQCEAYGRPLSTHWRDIVWQRGDIVFFPGHVGLMTSHDHLIHANAYAMKVTVDPLAEIVARGAEIIAIGRPR